jgi:hypothetical protein
LVAYLSCLVCRWPDAVVPGAAAVIETELVSDETRTKGFSREKDQVEELVLLGGPYFVAISPTDGSLAKADPSRPTEVGTVMELPHRSEGVGRGVVCGLLMERLHDVSLCFIFVLAYLLSIMFVTFMFFGNRLFL